MPTSSSPLLCMDTSVSLPWASREEAWANFLERGGGNRGGREGGRKGEEEGGSKGEREGRE